MKLLYSQTYGLGKMGLAKSGTAMYEQRAERIITRSGSHSLSSTPCKAVARTLDEVLEGIFRVKVRVDGQFLDSRNHERIYRLPLVPRESDRRIIRYLKCLVWIGNGAVYELDIVEQVSLLPITLFRVLPRVSTRGISSKWCIWASEGTFIVRAESTRDIGFTGRNHFWNTASGTLLFMIWRQRFHTSM